MVNYATITEHLNSVLTLMVHYATITYNLKSALTLMVHYATISEQYTNFGGISCNYD